jgi:4'-phosphopantetheinyl transferase
MTLPQRSSLALADHTRGRGVTSGPAPRGALAERRSVNRPKFVENWRKTIAPGSSDDAPQARQQMDYIDIWVAHPDSLLRAHSSLRLLMPEDWQVFDRISDSSMRHCAMASRILLRLGLSRAVDHRIAPVTWTFKTVARGKPAVADSLPDMKFSVSHTDGLAAVAISPHLEVGIDVEGVDQNVSENVVAGFSHPREKVALNDLLPRQKVREFIRLWTFKEALAKMIGTGMSLDFDTTQFRLDPAQLAAAAKNEQQCPDTYFESIYISIEHFLYHVSLAVENPGDQWRPTEVRIITLAEPKGAGVSS